MLFPGPEKQITLADIAAELGWPHKLQPGFVVWQSADSGLYARILVVDTGETALHAEVGIIDQGQEVANLWAGFAPDGYLIEAWKANLATDMDSFVREFSEIVASLGDPVIVDMEADHD